MEIKFKTIAIWGLLTTVIASENFFYLLDGENTKLLRIISLNDLCILLSIFWICTIMFLYRNLPSPKYHFKWIILFSLVLMITSSYQSYLQYNQNVFMGIRPQRFWIVWGLMYFPITKLLFLNKITYEKIVKIIFFIGTLELVIYISQYILQGKIQFLHVGSNDVYSTTRFYVSNIFLILLLFINLDQIFNRKKILRSALYIVAILFVIIIVGKMRMTFIAVIGAIMIGLLIWRRGGILKVIAFSIFIVAALFVSNLEEVKAIFLTLNGQATVNTLNIRELGREFYLSVLKQHPILGGGYINTQWEPAAVASGIYNKIYWVDNGIFGFAYFYGLLGVIWVMILFGKIYIMASKVRKKLKCYIFYIMPFYWLIAMYTEMHWYYNSFFVMTLFICMLEAKFRKIVR